MTPFNPQQIAEEAARDFFGNKNQPAAKHVAALILQAAARMVRGSGAVEALQDAQDTLHALSKIHPASVGEAWDEAGIDAALSALRSITDPKP